MGVLWLEIKAPFAAFRGFQAGVYRATSPIMPPSAAFGLVLNLAGIEMRDLTPGVTTLIRKDLPMLEIALGTMPETNSEVCTLYQQLHSYPVGGSGKDDLKPRTHGAKFWITPVKRELLVGFHMAIGVRSEDNGLLEKVKLGLAGELDESRYGLPFAGDNNLLFDRIDILTAPPLAKWYVQMDSKGKPMKGSYRLTVGIDRSDNSQTTSLLYAPIEEPTTDPPDEAWTWTLKQPTLTVSR